jgi:hypothetical protein
LGSRALVLAQAVLTLLAPHQLLRQRARLQRARDTRRAKPWSAPAPPALRAHAPRTLRENVGESQAMMLIVS